MIRTLHWRHNGRDGVSNHQPHHCLLNCLFRYRSQKTLKLCVTGLWAENSPQTGEFPAQMASNAENVSIWWRHHGKNIWEEYMRWDQQAVLALLASVLLHRYNCTCASETTVGMFCSNFVILMITNLLPSCLLPSNSAASQAVGRRCSFGSGEKCCCLWTPPDLVAYCHRIHPIMQSRDCHL